MSSVRPLLAKKADYGQIKYPVLATPKLDGIRCLAVNGVAMSRKMKPIPNKFIREQLEGLHGLDGEIMLNGDFNEVQSGVMSAGGEPDFTYHVFDIFALELPYKERVAALEHPLIYSWHERVKVVLPVVIMNEESLDLYLESCINKGYEGVMIRQPDSKYKFGRSTVNEGILLKIKRFSDDEGTLVEVTEKMTNGNEMEQDELGYAKRSACKENLIPAGTAGAVIIDWKGKRFKVGFGPGFTDVKKKQLWDERKELTGKLVTFRYQDISKDGIPRFGKMVCIRHKDDLN